MHRVYIAGQYARRSEFGWYAEELKRRGYQVVSSWLEEEYSPTTLHTDLPDTVNKLLAMRDMEDIAFCDTMLFFAEDPEHQPRRGGRHVEFGVALAQGKTIHVIGEKENIFHYLHDPSEPIYHHRDFAAFCEALDAQNLN